MTENWGEFLKGQADRYHSTFSLLVVIILPFWGYFDYIVIEDNWKYFAYIRVILSLFLGFALILHKRAQITHIVLGHAFSFVMIFCIGLGLPFIENNAVMYWCLGYSTCFITSHIFQTWDYKYHLFWLFLSFLTILFLLLLNGRDIDFYLKNGLLLLISVAAGSSGFFFARMYMLKQNFILSSKIKSLNAEIIEKDKLATIGMLSSGVAHQLGNTINTISFSNMNLKRAIDKNKITNDLVLDTISIIEKSIGSSKEIIRGLDFATKTNEKKSSLDLSEIVDTAFVLTKGLTLEKVKTKNNVPLGTLVSAKSNSLLQIFMNLISNSCHAMHQTDGAEITVESKIDDHFIYIIFSDNGPGIDKNIKNKIFDPFVTSKDSSSGSGVGLYVVRQELSNLNGIIKIIERSDIGASFEIRLERGY